MTRVVFVSDLHTKDIDPPEGDLLINCGDWTFVGKASEVNWSHGWLTRQANRYKAVVWVAGNHDFDAEEWGPRIAEETGTIYLESTGCEVLGLKIWGSPYTPTFYDWHFMADRGNDIRKIWKQIPEGLDILITHGPPYGILDSSPGICGNVGCWDLLDIVRRQKPKYHCFGHIHGGYGTKVVGDTTFINCAICDEAYFPEHAPIVIDI